MPVHKHSAPLRVRLEKPDSDSYIEFFQTPDGLFERVDHNGASVFWQHFVKPEDMANTIFFCSKLGYIINGGVKYEYEKPV